MDPIAIGRMVDIVADLDQVLVHLGGRLVAQHRRSWGTALSITDPVHVTTAARLREAFSKPRHRSADYAVAEVVLPDLAVYNTAFGVDLNVDGDTGIEEAS